MKLAKITNEDPIKNVKIKMHESKVELINAYRAMYKKTYGEELDFGLFLEHVAENFINTDKEFLNSLKKKSESKKAEAPDAQPQQNLNI